MNLLDILNDKTLKGKAKTKKITDLIVSGKLSLADIEKVLKSIDDKQLAVILQAIEEITNKGLKKLDSSYLSLAEKYITSDSNAVKREASRIVGNLAKDYPDKLNSAIKSLMKNIDDDSTVVRWGSAYGLSRILEAGDHATSELYDKVKQISAKETDNGVKNQYVKALKQADKKRKEKD